MSECQHCGQPAEWRRNATTAIMAGDTVIAETTTVGFAHVATGATNCAKEV